jgi:hypothetical protein
LSGRNSGAGVLHAQYRFVVLGMQADANALSRVGELHRVGEQIADDLRQARGVAVDPSGSFATSSSRSSLRGAAAALRLDVLADQGREVDALRLQARLCRARCARCRAGRRRGA